MSAELFGCLGNFYYTDQMHLVRPSAGPKKLSLDLKTKSALCCFRRLPCFEQDPPVFEREEATTGKACRNRGRGLQCSRLGQGRPPGTVWSSHTFDFHVALTKLSLLILPGKPWWVLSKQRSDPGLEKRGKTGINTDFISKINIDFSRAHGSR